MADTPRSLAELPLSVQNTLKNIGARPTATVNEFFQALRTAGYNPEVASNLARQAAESREYKALTPSEPESRSQSPNSNTAKQGTQAAGIAGAGLAEVFKDRSQSAELVNHMNAEKIDFERDNIGQMYNNITAALGENTPEWTAQAQAIIAQLNPDTLLSQQVAQLRTRVQDAAEDTGNDATPLLKKMDERETNMQKKRQDPRAIAKRNADFQERSDVLFKQLRAAKTAEQKQAIFQKFVRDQHDLNRQDLQTLLTKWPIAKRSILAPNIRKNLFNRYKTEDADRKKREEAEQAARKKQQEQQGQPTSSQNPSLDDIKRVQKAFEEPPAEPVEPNLPQEFPESAFEQMPTPEIAPEIPSIPEVRPNIFSRLLSGFGGNAAAEGGEALFFTQPEFWVPIGVGLVVLFVIILVIILLSGSGNFYTIGTPEQETCGDTTFLVPDVQDELTQFANETDPVFHVADLPIINGSTNQQTTDAVSAYKTIWNTLCILYGHIPSGLSGPNGFNTFSRLLLGDYVQQLTIKGKKTWTWAYKLGKGAISGELVKDDNGKLAKKPKGSLIEVWVDPDDTSQPSCTVQFWPKAQVGNKSAIEMEFINTQACGTPYALQFLITQALSHAVIVQQADVLGKSDLLTNFETNAYTASNLLPTNSCQGTFGLVYGGVDGKVFTKGTSPIGENTKNQQERNCFGDMVGAYLTYPWFFDGSSALITPMATPTATLTPSLTPTASTSSATLVSSPLSDYPSGQWQNYYTFAKQYLFDNVDFVSNPNGVVASCPSIPTNDDFIKSGLKSWGITVNTDSSLPSSSVTSTILRNVYQTICLDYQSGLFKRLVNADTSLANPTPLNITFSNSECRGAGYTPAGNTIYLCMQGGSTTIDPNPDHIQYYLTHELGHIIQHRNQDIVNAWTQTYTSSALSSHYLYTVNCNGQQTAAKGLDQKAECLSDAIALYTTYGNFTDGSFGGFGANPLSAYLAYDTDTNWQPYYQFVSTQIFNNTTFFPLPGSSSGTGSSISDYATKLATTIVQGCPKPNPPYTSNFLYSNGTIIYDSDIGCLRTILTGYPTAVLQQLINDILPFTAQSIPTLQCVGFARAVLLGINHPFPSVGNAREYAGNALADNDPNHSMNDYSGMSINGYTWYSEATLKRNNTSLQAGDVAIFVNGLNHIAIVTKPLGSGASNFLVAEASGATGLVEVNRITYHFDQNFAGIYRLGK